MRIITKTIIAALIACLLLAPVAWCADSAPPPTPSPQFAPCSDGTALCVTIVGSGIDMKDDGTGNLQFRENGGAWNDIGSGTGEANPATATQAEMETGTESALRSVSPLLVAQAIAYMLTAHSSGADHDGRYYTEAEIDAAMALKVDTTLVDQDMTIGAAPVLSVNNMTGTLSSIQIILGIESANTAGLLGVNASDQLTVGNQAASARVVFSQTDDTATNGDTTKTWSADKIYDQLALKQGLDADLTTLATPTAWRVFYSDGGQNIQEVALGASGTVLKSNGATAAPTFQTDSTGSGSLGTNLSSSTDDILSDNGTILIGGTGGTNNETLDWDFETTANAVGVSSPSGVTRIDAGSLQFATTGVVLGAVNISPKSDATYTVGTDDAKESYGTLFINADNDAIAFTLPSAVAGMSGCFMQGQGVSGAITVTPGASNYLVADGVRGTAATAYTSTGAGGDKLCVIAQDATDWIVTTSQGTWSE